MTYNFQTFQRLIRKRLLHPAIAQGEGLVRGSLRSRTSNHQTLQAPLCRRKKVFEIPTKSSNLALSTVVISKLRYTNGKSGLRSQRIFTIFLVTGTKTFENNLGQDSCFSVGVLQLSSSDGMAPLRSNSGWFNSSVYSKPNPSL